MLNFLCFGENAYICNTEKPIKIAVMEENADITKKENYRITIILKDEIITEKFYRRGPAMETVATMRKLFPNVFVGGAIEERKKRWEVIWTLGNQKETI